MLARCLSTCRRSWPKIPKSKPSWQIRQQALSSTAATGGIRLHPFPAPLSALISDLDSVAPRIDIDASQVQIIESPSDFYSTLKNKILAARENIYLSTLYIGKSEHELVSTIGDSLTQNESLKVSILTDALRGTREYPQPSCASLLVPLVRDFPGRAEIRMYHTPNLTGLRKALIPQRINEGWGLQHVKLYGIDDEVILSGANLSNDYFTNRQDRYHLFTSKEVSGYFARIHNALCSISFILEPSLTSNGHTLTWPATNKAPNPLLNSRKHLLAATSVLKPVMRPATVPSPQPQQNTSLYPLFCLPPKFNTELPALITLLTPARPIEGYTFTAGYFNPHPIITQTLLELSSPPLSSPGTILTAHPHANGFFGSKGISGMLPAAYSHLSLRFLQAAQGKSIQLREWQRGTVGQPRGWTYHAKGLWVTFPPTESRSEVKAAGPSVTLIGSSNYTARSYGLDLEVGAMVVTADEGLQRKFSREEKLLGQYTGLITEEQLKATDRRASWKVRLAMWIVEKAGGAL